MKVETSFESWNVFWCSFRVSFAQEGSDVYLGTSSVGLCTRHLESQTSSWFKWVDLWTSKNQPSSNGSVHTCRWYLYRYPASPSPDVAILSFLFTMDWMCSVELYNDTCLSRRDRILDSTLRCFFFFLQERRRKTTDNIKLYEIKAVVKRFIKGEIFCETQNNIISRKDTKTTEKWH